MVIRDSSGAEQGMWAAAGKRGSAVPECAIVVVAVVRPPKAESYRFGADVLDRDPAATVVYFCTAVLTCRRLRKNCRSAVLSSLPKPADQTALVSSSTGAIQTNSEAIRKPVRLIT